MTTASDSAPKRRLISRILLPPPFHEPPRDLVATQSHREGFERGLVLGLVAYLPIAGIVLVTVNLLIQVHGYQGLAIAIIENLSLASLTLVVVSNLLQIALGAFVIACARVLADRTFAASVRRSAGILAAAGIVVALLALPWYLAAFFAVLTYLTWRVRIRTVVKVTDWMKGPPPNDAISREIWMEGRRRMRADGDAVPAIAGIVEPLSDSPPRDLNSLSDSINERVSEIQKATPRTIYSALVAGLLAVIPIYGYNAVTLQIQFAPLEKVTFSTGDPQVGYVFSTGGAPGIFVPRSMDNAIFLDHNPLTSRELCAFNYSSGSLLGVAKRSTGAECS